ncbi:low-density lipoprotein receptor class A domain-containing protein 1 isoform X1 [Lutra lutra]|uniref:low-density lipoprotein receptor class A domain-containing protein 1 isoform X1 n=1 Tax=Lutra lutra TaxID=9657 RepID=UPI001FD37088|nr:low-density lipoprotein receptor class A domain-containing protein 1 isoform X1 [Lutra lutra]
MEVSGAPFSRESFLLPTPQAGGAPVGLGKGDPPLVSHSTRRLRPPLLLTPGSLPLSLLAAPAGHSRCLDRPGLHPGIPTTYTRTGFLCHDRRSCIPASRVCDGVRTCAHGEDEDEAMCRDMPQSLPSFLVARCGDPSFWIYSDQKCDGTNNCGDCSDELSPVTTCPPCGPGWWRCPSTVFRYCGCIPRSLCRDHTQHCSDWSDEYSCPGP